MFAIQHRVITAIIKAEGRYDNNPSDPGGETYCGISRVYHPAWAGWATIDKAKQEDEEQLDRTSLSEKLSNDVLFEELQEAVYGFWVEYLSSQRVDCCPEILQLQFAQVAATSPKMAMECLQRCCVWVFPTQLPASFVDGKYGPSTEEWVEELAGLDDPEHIRMAFALAAVAGYARRGRGEQQQFLRGWILRTLKSWREGP